MNYYASIFLSTLTVLQCKCKVKRIPGSRKQKMKQLICETKHTCFKIDMVFTPHL